MLALGSNFNKYDQVPIFLELPFSGRGRKVIDNASKEMYNIISGDAKIKLQVMLRPKK